MGVQSGGGLPSSIVRCALCKRVVKALRNVVVDPNDKVRLGGGVEGTHAMTHAVPACQTLPSCKAPPPVRDVPPCKAVALCKALPLPTRGAPPEMPLVQRPRVR